MEKTPTRRLIIKNNSRWSLKIDGKLLEAGKHILIRTIPEKITYQPYGPPWEALGTPQTIDLVKELRNLHFEPNIDEDLVLTINIPYTRWAPTINLEIQPAILSPLETATEPPQSRNGAPPDPWEAFPSLMKHFSKQFYWFRLKAYVSHLNKNYPRDLARYVLGLPASPSRKDISDTYKRLSIIWHPDKHPEGKDPKKKKLLDQIFGIVKRAHDILYGTEQNFDEYLKR